MPACPNCRATDWRMTSTAALITAECRECGNVVSIERRPARIREVIAMACAEQERQPCEFDARPPM